MFEVFEHVFVLGDHCLLPMVHMPMGVVLRGVLDDAEQRWLYEQIWSSAQDTKTLHELCNACDPEHQACAQDLELAKRVPLPLAFWKHPYSRLSSIREPPPLDLRGGIASKNLI